MFLEEYVGTLDVGVNPTGTINARQLVTDTLQYTRDHLGRENWGVLEILHEIAIHLLHDLDMTVM